MAKATTTQDVNIIPSDLSSQASSIRGTMNRSTAAYRQSLNATDEKIRREKRAKCKKAYDELLADVIELGRMMLVD